MTNWFEVLNGFLIELVKVDLEAVESLLIEDSPLEFGLETVFVLLIKVDVHF